MADSGLGADSLVTAVGGRLDRGMTAAAVDVDRTEAAVEDTGRSHADLVGELVRR